MPSHSQASPAWHSPDVAPMQPNPTKPLRATTIITETPCRTCQAIFMKTGHRKGRASHELRRIVRKRTDSGR